MYEDIPFQEYNDRAQALFERFGFDPAEKPVFDPEILIRKMGITIKHEPFPPIIQPKIMACLVKDFIDGSYSIYIDQSHYNDPRRGMFTLGEELGHYILHRKFYTTVNTKTDLISTALEDQYYRHREQQAKQFSSQILLPSQGFKNFLHKFRIKHGMEKIEYREGLADEKAYDLAQEIGPDPEIGLSEYIIEIALKRWPDRPIDEFFISEKKPSNRYGGFDDF